MRVSDQKRPQALNESIAVRVIPENQTPVDSPANDVMQSPRRIDARFSRHTPLNKLKIV
ncbi:MAG: hypothetical protein MZV70_08725 [Desulfobacterales bacterium]|nr:hypothetical protein [Desulfobacterales bacterium]